jgi:hypothetical protein
LIAGAFQTAFTEDSLTIGPHGVFLGSAVISADKPRLRPLKHNAIAIVIGSPIWPARRLAERQNALFDGSS